MEIFLWVFGAWVVVAVLVSLLVPAQRRGERHVHHRVRPRTRSPSSPRPPNRPPRISTPRSHPRGHGLPAVHDLARNEPGEALVRQAIAETGGALGNSSWHKGIEGEERMADLLLLLEERGWKVLHSVPCPVGGDIDHLAIGPGGIWAINTKNRPRKRISVTSTGVTESGAPSDPELLQRSGSEAESAAEVLSHSLRRDVEVRPALAYVGVSAVVGEHRSEGVLIMEGTRLINELDSADVEFGPSEVADIYAVARDARHWLRLNGT